MPSAYEALLDTVAARLTPLDTDAPTKVRDASRCPVALLGHLAWSRGLDYWSSEWPEQNKRELIRQTPANLRRRGTRAAIDAAIGAFDTAIDIREWWEGTPSGAPGTAVASVDADSPIGRIPGGQEALRVVLGEARNMDSITLWHLYIRTSRADRAAVYDRLSSLVPPPLGVTRDGMLAGDPEMIKVWRKYLNLGMDGWWKVL